MFECQFKQMMKNDKELRDYLENHDVITIKPLNVRDAFYGGRVNAAKLYHKADYENGEVIEYVDFTSLYPTVNKVNNFVINLNAMIITMEFCFQYDKLPLGHPINIRIGHQECQGFEEMDGLVKCKILPPTNLYHPVLPQRINGRLMFALCRSCAESENQHDCNHSDVEDRSFTGTWVIDEVKLAISKGYKVLECYEVWEYNVTQYNPKTKSGGIFAEYVNNFLKLKQMASGWPRSNMSEQEKQEYIANYNKHEGIDLDYNLIAHNAALRALAKLLLNSLWGKFGQRSNMSKTAFFNNEDDLFRLLLDPSIEVTNVDSISDLIVCVNWKYRDDVYVPSPNVNPVIAAYTTTFARIRLYNVLDQLGDRILYYDTDSAMFTRRPGQFMPPTGDYLGDLTDEVSCYGEGSFIMEYVSNGPKNYSYKVAICGDVNNTKVVCKVKGLSLNYQNSKLVNFESLKDKVIHNAEPTIIHNDKKICRLSNHTIVSKPETKTHQLVYRKRRLIDDYCTIPYGFKKCKIGL
jgi:hypothetical protein